MADRQEHMDPWHYDPAGDLEQSLVERLRRFPREPDMLVYGLRSMAAILTRGWLKTYHRFSIVGRERLPADGSFVMVANHSSHLDALCLLAALPLGKVHRAFPAAARDYFFVTVPRLAAAAVLVNAVPFERHASPRQTLSTCRNLLENPGNILMIFPEGTRSTSGELGDFKPGIGLLVAGTKLPIVPCYLEGALRAWPKGAWLPRPRRVCLTIGEPRQYSHLGTGKTSALKIAQDLRNSVLSLRAFSSTNRGISNDIGSNHPSGESRSRAD
jgi:1-acyl-sn-glycerol-3-phosphate acyltransferase